MSIILTRGTEARLREQAERMGEDVNTLADTLLANVLASHQSLDDTDDLTEDQFAQIRTGIRRGLAASTGRERPVAEYIADVQKRHAARHAETVPHA